MIRQHQRFLNIMQVSLDAMFLFISYTGSILLKLSLDKIDIVNYKYIIGPLWMVPLLLVSYYFMEVYSPMRSRLDRKEVLIITRAHLVGIVIIFSILFLRKTQEFSREVSLLFATFGLLFVMLERY